jgi:hypothetical protein
MEQEYLSDAQTKDMYPSLRTCPCCGKDIHVPKMQSWDNWMSSPEMRLCDNCKKDNYQQETKWVKK